MTFLEQIDWLINWLIDWLIGRQNFENDGSECVNILSLLVQLAFKICSITLILCLTRRIELLFQKKTFGYIYRECYL